MVPLDYRTPEGRRRRFRPIPVRMLVPNVITLLAICAGLTAIRLSTEGKMEWAVAAIVFAISGGLRLARFNATIDDPNKPPYAGNYFTGVPAPMGAILAMLPIYLAFLGTPKPPAALTAAYTLLIAFLMVSRLPVYSGKQVRMRVPPEMVLPVFVSVIFFIAILIGYPWHVLSVGSVLYLASLPLGWKSYKDHERAAAAQAAPAADATTTGPAQTFSAPVAENPSEDERPERLH
jgi:CDP-diacylglycerol---serine O-phosphatidyltransferase